MRRSSGTALGTFTALSAMALAGCAPGASDAQGAPEAGGRINPLIALHEQGQPVFGLYAPSPRARRGDDGDGEPAMRTPAERAEETMAYAASDYVFDGSMEDGVNEKLPSFVAYVEALRDAGATARTNPLVVKTVKISEDPEAAAAGIARQLDAGVSGIMFVGVESAEEVRRGLAAMRYESDGGTRPDRVGSAPAYWGVSEEEYRAKADLWPLDPRGELINWTIVESVEGLAKVREIAAVPGIGVLWPGAGTLRRVFSATGPDAERVLDEEAWENAIQQVLAACKEFDVPCGYPAGPDDIEMRVRQGFSVFVMGWGEEGFATVERGKELAGR